MKTQLLYAAASLLVLAGCGHKTEDKAGAARSVNAQTQWVQAGPVPEVYAAPATLVAVESVPVASRIMGYIRAVDVVEGQAVKIGQRLFTVDPADARSQADQTAAALADAKANYERYAALYKEEAVSRQHYDKMKLAYDQTRAAAEGAGNQLRYAVVASPINGVVTQKLGNAGSLAVPGQPVLVVENPARLQVQTQVGAEVLRQLRSGTVVPVEVDGVSGRIDARVAQISPAADPVSRTFLVKLDIAATGLKSGLFARALFPQGERAALLLPKAAVIERAGIAGAFAVDANGIAQFRMLRLGAERDGQVEVQAGLSAGERVAISGLDQLESGDKVAGVGNASKK
ncbi:MAG: efflux RND transporter periplasmic adaptor subunit [Betaproteobacteria bacterium]|nr:efflux RND transporter periplasmic adaptor subunit [Betaproteobacteria bacterium]